jgi:hypothetical protein
MYFECRVFECRCSVWWFLAFLAIFWHFWQFLAFFEGLVMAVVSGVGRVWWWNGLWRVFVVVVRSVEMRVVYVGFCG